MSKSPKSVAEYLASLPQDRRAALEAIREVIRANLDPAFEEGIQYGMIGYYLPHSRYPAGYHCDPKQPLPFAGVASQKRHIGLYLFCIYGNDGEREQFCEEWLATGKRLDMGKGCVRVTKLSELPLEVLGRAIRRMTAQKFVAHYEQAMQTNRVTAKTRAAAKASSSTTQKAIAKPKLAKKPVAKKPVAGKTSAKKSGKKSATKRPMAEGAAPKPAKPTRPTAKR